MADITDKLEMIDPKKLAESLDTRQVMYVWEKMNAGKLLTGAEHQLLNDFKDRILGPPGEKSEIFANAKALGEHYGVKKATVSLAVKRGRITRNDDGTFDKAVTDAYWCDKLGKPRKPIKGYEADPGEVSNGDPPVANTIQAKIEVERLRKMTAEAEAKELLTASMRRALVPREEIITEWCKRATAFRNAIMNLSKRMPPLLVNRPQNEIEKLLREEGIVVLKSLIEKGEYTPEC